ncbi:MAG: class I SAM-dependent methyltransferase [Planctomycetota bacterium]
MTTTTMKPAEHAEKMDRIYKMQRHFYDVTRKYYLLGRDVLIERMALRPGMKVLEIGCGTARNLIALARKHPQIQFYGLDASREMLATAQAKIDAAKLTDRITLKFCLAEELDAKRTFDLDAPFDAMFFSYSLSMIPTWRESLDAAFRNLKPGEFVYSVDFWDQQEYPGIFRWALVKWLDLFHVKHRPELLEYMNDLKNRGVCSLDLSGLYGRYSYIASMRSKMV